MLNSYPILGIITEHILRMICLIYGVKKLLLTLFSIVSYFLPEIYEIDIFYI